MSKGSKVVFVAFTQHCIQSNVTHLTHVRRVKRSLNSFNCYSCYSCRKVESGVCGWYTQYRYIQCYVQRVEGLCHVETRDKHIFAHNFLNIQPIFNPKKVLESWDLELSNHIIQCHVCWRSRKLFWLSTPSTCFDIYSIGWYGWKGLSLSFPKLFSDWKSVKY